MLRSKCCVRNVMLDLFPHAGGWGRGHAGRGGGCCTFDFCRFTMDLDGFLARAFALFVKSCTLGV